jgi:hypothetical protein
MHISKIPKNNPPKLLPFLYIITKRCFPPLNTKCNVRNHFYTKTENKIAETGFTRLTRNDANARLFCSHAAKQRASYVIQRVLEISILSRDPQRRQEEEKEREERTTIVRADTCHSQSGYDILRRTMKLRPAFMSLDITLSCSKYSMKVKGAKYELHGSVHTLPCNVSRRLLAHLAAGFVTALRAQLVNTGSPWSCRAATYPS